MIYRTIRDLIKDIRDYMVLKLRFRGKLRFTFTTDVHISSTFEGANVIGDNTKFCGNTAHGQCFRALRVHYVKSRVDYLLFIT